MRSMKSTPRSRATRARKSAVSYAASSALAKQIEDGAPADIFISADLDWMDYLAKKNLIKPETRANLLGNQLVLIAPANSTVKLDIGPDFPLAQALGDGRLAMADPSACRPANTARRRWRRSASGLPSPTSWRPPRTSARACCWSRAARRRSASSTRPTPPPSQGVKIVGTFPADTPPADRLSDRRGGKFDESRGRRDYVAFLRSPTARPIFEKQGFTVLH